jgi:Ni,Fe-hydrogenase I large subunit
MRINVDPVTRIEGHLSVSLDIVDGRVSAAYCSGTMFRGFEAIVSGRDPLDAVQITQRICGVCPVSHGIASSLALEAALGIVVPDNGRLLRNLILGANYLQSAILHFYILSALDFVDITAIAGYTGRDPRLVAVRDWVKAELQRKSLHPAAPFLPRYTGDYIPDADVNIGAIDHYLQALHMRELAHEMVALFGGKIPHVAALVVGGVTSTPTVDRIEAYRARLQELQAFINEAYLPDVVAVAKAYPQYFQVGKGPSTYLSYGGFPENADRSNNWMPAGVYRDGQVAPLDPGKITEDTGHAWFKSASGLHPSRGQTDLAPDKADAYSWVKAPRYAGEVVEVGPLARVLVAHASGSNPALSNMLSTSLSALGLTEEALFSVLGRHLARAIECKLLADRIETWLDALRPSAPSCQPYHIPKTGAGAGLMEAPRGALGHWVEVADGLVKRYQCVVPTTWNCSPRDDRGQPGAVEQSLAGVAIADRDSPIEAMRVVRAFDPCLACAVH